MSRRVPVMPCITCLGITCLALMLCACGKAADQPSGTAVGAQVLPGTISDAMLNLDRSQAQPLLQPAPKPHGAASDAPDDSASDAAEAPAGKPR